MTFIAQFSEIQAEITRQGIAAYDMRDEGHLEMVYVGQSGIDRDDADYRERVGFKLLLGETGGPKPIPEPIRASPIRYFLDGAQRTLRAFYCQSIPIVAGVVTAAVLERNGTGEPRITPGMIAFRHAWIIPKRSNVSEVDRLIDVIRSKGGDVVDPLDDARFDDDERYATELHEFGGLMEHAFKRVGALRTELEIGLLERWCSERVGDSLLLVDGPIRQESCGAVGLVKAFTRQYFLGSDATTLFRLQYRERTAAFTVQDQWRLAPVDAWYQRHFSADGRDPRHALVRIELSSNAPDKPDIDEVAGWVMRERAPSAKNDARWATLLYPVHYLEEILKRHIDAQTRGWTTRR